ncbi:MAG: hypothetical protein HKP61_15725 [Dactylosporangium sp.]|nr:hypothetical protein [Dactylosporangium sp.]NNJ62355.1 hypothetical protein [Dactylosporangium sp.]
MTNHCEHPGRVAHVARDATGGTRTSNDLRDAETHVAPGDPGMDSDTSSDAPIVGSDPAPSDHGRRRPGPAHRRRRVIVEPSAFVALDAERRRTAVAVLSRLFARLLAAPAFLGDVSRSGSAPEDPPSSVQMPPNPV